MKNQKTLLITFLLIYFSLSPVFAQIEYIGGWGPDTRLTFNDSISYTTSNTWCVAASGNRVHVIWSDNRGIPPEYEQYKIYHKRSTNGGRTWSTDNCISNHVTTFDPCPSIVVSGSYVYVVWVYRFWDPDKEQYVSQVLFKRSTNNGLTWCEEINFTPSIDSRVNYPCVAAYGSHVHVAWHYWDDIVTHNAYIQYLGSWNYGAGWGPSSTTLSDSTIGLKWNSRPSIAAYGSNVHVAWNNGHHLFASIQYAHSMDGGSSWTPDTRIVDIYGGTGAPSIAAYGSKVHLVWEDGRNFNDELYYKRSTNSGISWEDEYSIVDTIDVCDPSLALYGSALHVVWQGGWNYPDIYYKKSTNAGITWKSDKRLTNDPADSWSPSVAVANPKIHVVWTDWRDGNPEIYYKRCWPITVYPNPPVLDDTTIVNPGSIPDGGDKMCGKQKSTDKSGCETIIEKRKQNCTEELHVSPNPFISYARVLGHEHKEFLLYDTSGRLVGTYRGNMVGSGVCPGVYFLKSVSENSPPMRIVKLK